MILTFDHNFGTRDEPFGCEIHADFSEGGGFDGFSVWHEGEEVPEAMLPDPLMEQIDELCLQVGRDAGIYRDERHASLTVGERNPSMGRGR